MRVFFQDIHKTRLLHISNNDPSSRVCGWPGGRNWQGICSAEGVIENVFYYPSPFKNPRFHGNYHIQYLPNSVTNIRIRSAKLSLPVHTRTLPARCEELDLQYNHIPNSIDLHALPSGMVTLNMAHNRLSGNISLTKLPRVMQTINFMINNLEQRVLYYDDLPKGLMSVYLHSSGIKAMKPLHAASERKVSFF